MYVRSKFDPFTCLVVSGMVLLFLVVAFLMIVPSVGNQRTFDATVVKTYVDGGNTFFVLQEKDGVPFPVANEDNMFFWKFNSGDFLVGITVGKTYTFTTVGWRWPFFSAFPNIIRFIPK